jgi:hypothetical protein
MKQEETESIGMQVEINVGNTRIYSTYIPLQARSYGGGRWGSAPPESGNCPPPLEKLGHNYYIFSKTYFLSIQKLNE